MTVNIAKGSRAIALALASGLAGFGAAEQVSAQETGPVVIELFSSQGCSSCPPADEMLGDLVGREDVIALALHVDYWDYIGWADTFAQPSFTARQYGYGHAAGSTVVYTPQMVINGQDHVAGYRPMQVVDLIAAHRAAPRPVALQAEAAVGGFAISASWTGPVPAPRMEVHIVSYLPEATVEITRGENAGRTSHHYNVAQGWQVVGEWDGAAPWEGVVELGGDLPHVLIVQAADHGPIFGAVRLD